MGVAGLGGAEIEDAVTKEAEAIAAAARELVPIETGALHDSIHVETHRGRQEISASIVAGGPDVAYAAKVHYDLDLQHETGQSHFIHQPFFEASGRPMLRRLAAGIDLKRAAR